MRSSFRLCVVVLTSAFLACTSVPPRNDCSIAPPKDYQGDKEAAAKVGADLTALAEAPVKANFEASFKTTVKETFQTIPERDVACQMLLQTVACLSKQRSSQTAVDSLLRYIREDDKCGAPSAKNQADGFVQETLKRLVYLEAGQQPIYFLMGLHCYRTDAPPTEQLIRAAKYVLPQVQELQKLASSAPAADIVVTDFGSFRQLALDLAAREEMLAYFASDPIQLDRAKICDMASRYEDLHRRLAVIEASYHRYLQSTPRFSQVSGDINQ